MKKRTIYLLILTVATVGCVIFGTLWNVGLNFSFSHHNVSGNMVEKSGELEAFDSIVMDMDVMGIEIKNGSGYSIRYCCTDNLIPEYKVKNGVLYVTQEQKIHYNTNNADMTLTLPSGTDLKKIDIRVDVGDVTLSDLTADYCKAASDVGDFTAKNSTLNELLEILSLTATAAWKIIPLKFHRMLATSRSTTIAMTTSTTASAKTARVKLP